MFSIPPFPKQGRLPLSNSILIPLNVQIPAIYHTLSLFHLFCSFQRNSLHLSFIPIRSNITRKPFDWCRQINSVFFYVFPSLLFYKLSLYIVLWLCQVCNNPNVSIYSFSFLLYPEHACGTNLTSTSLSCITPCHLCCLNVVSIQ
jgi:hypothetical protein